MSASRDFAIALAREMIFASPNFREMRHPQQIELEEALMASYWAGMNNDPAVNKIKSGESTPQ